MYLVINVNNRCDLSCSFCCQKDRLDDNDMTRLSSDRLREVLKGIGEPLTNVMILGGESLLDFPLVAECVGVIRGNLLQRHATITVVTNGLTLTREVANWANDNNVYMSISVDGIERSQRPLDNLVYNSVAGIDIYQIIRSLNVVELRRVISNPFQNFAASVYNLRQIFPSVNKITFRFDHYKLGELNIQHLHHVSRQFLMLRSLDPNFADWFHFDDMTLFDQVCDCTKNHHLGHDGILSPMSEKCGDGDMPVLEDNGPIIGCSHIADLMTREKYYAWCAHVGAMLDAARSDNP